MPTSSTCSNLHNLAKTWQEALKDSQRALETFQRTFSDNDRAALTQALESTRAAQEAYETVSKTLVEFKGKQVVAREAVLLKWMGGLIGKVGIEVSETGNATGLNVSENESAESDINNAMKFVKVFQGLTWLRCFNTNISSLPELPQGLTCLDCFSTNLTQLPKLPQGLKELFCSNTNLTQLPELPEGLTRLGCHHNKKLYSLPKLPRELVELDCSNNPKLSFFPDPLPDTLIDFDIRNTPVAQDLQIRARLVEFKVKHPSARLRY